jgi:CspA family cold shock protein
MPTGKVKWFSAQRGYGFIVPDDGGADTFVHISTVERAGLGLLSEGQRVSTN